MGAREELLEAAKRLTASGRSPFAPVELIEEARRAGCNYPDTTLRTFIVGPMCLNSPDHHAVQYGDLVRVSRGSYRLASASDDAGGSSSQPRRAERSSPAEVESTAVAPAEEWFWEGNVQAAVVGHLAADGWQVRRVADTASRERGVDIEAVRDGTRLLIEVKGYPSTTYSRGERAGQPKRTSAPLQARAYFSNALLSGVLMRADNAEARVVLAFPAMETYETLSTRSAGPLAAAGIELWLVAEDGAVRAVDSV